MSVDATHNTTRKITQQVSFIIFKRNKCPIIPGITIVWMGLAGNALLSRMNFVLCIFSATLDCTLPILVQVSFTIRLQDKECKIFFKVDRFPCLRYEGNFTNQTIVLVWITEGSDAITCATTYFFCCFLWT
jgi:hypothetical protein